MPFDFQMAQRLLPFILGGGGDWNFPGGPGWWSPGDPTGGKGPDPSGGRKGSQKVPSGHGSTAPLQQYRYPVASKATQPLKRSGYAGWDTINPIIRQARLGALQFSDQGFMEDPRYSAYARTHPNTWEPWLDPSTSPIHNPEARMLAALKLRHALEGMQTRWAARRAKRGQG